MMNITALKDETIFDLYALEKDSWPPQVRALKGQTPLLAHVETDDGIEGEVEPLVGREIDDKHGRFGVLFSAARLCYLPGGRVKKGSRLRIGDYGIWKLV